MSLDKSVTQSFGYLYSKALQRQCPAPDKSLVALVYIPYIPYILHMGMSSKRPLLRQKPQNPPEYGSTAEGKLSATTKHKATARNMMLYAFA
jgi:hypothetical protein